jgi:molybdate transport repressor ModE-like protein/molybdopterin-binding protein
MTRRPAPVTATDVAILRSVAQQHSVVAAARSLGIPRDRATYRLQRLARAFGGPVVSADRGGRTHGRTVLTSLGHHIVRSGPEAVEVLEGRPVVPWDRPNLLRGIYYRRPSARVDVGAPQSLRVTFEGTEEEPVGIVLEPEAIVLARSEFVSSARNVLRGEVLNLGALSGQGPRRATYVRVRWGPWRLKVAITPESIRTLELRRGSPVWLYIKATAIRRIAVRGSGATNPVIPGSPRRSGRRPPRPRGGSGNR